MVDGLYGLWHYGIVGSNYDDGQVGNLCTTGTHRSKCLVTRSVKEGNSSAAWKHHVVCTNMLRDTTGLTGNHIGLSYIVKQRGLTVVNVTHYGNDRRTLLHILRAVNIILLVDSLLNLCCNKINLVSELFSNKHKSLCVKTLVDGNHQTEVHTCLNYLCNRNIDHY